jgi:hypothetical protein
VQRPKQAIAIEEPPARDQGGVAFEPGRYFGERRGHGGVSGVGERTHTRLAGFRCNAGIGNRAEQAFRFTE